MPVAPYLSKSVDERLKELNPHLYAKWDGHCEIWDIWFDDTIKIPYVILRTNIIDDTTYTQVRYALWVSKHLTYHLKRGHAQSKEIIQKKLRDEEDDFYQMGKEVVPLLQSLKDAGTSSHGRSVTMFPGFGKGIAI